jgi:glyoxylase-like metal-dependent hydrolase (beta-lactamase superfamily II)
MPYHSRLLSILSAIIAAFLFLFSSTLSAQELDRSYGLKELKPGYYVYLHGDDTPGISSTFNNGVIVTNEGVVVIDTQRTEAIAGKVREAISRVTPQPIRFLISTTPHNPFTGGNAVYADCFKIGHENYRTSLLKLLPKDSAEDLKKKLPDQTFSERLTLYLGGKEIQIIYLGKAHSQADTMVYVPADRIVYMGETFYSDELPYISEGYSLSWMRAIETAEALKADIYVPGHGFLPKNLNDTRAGLRSHWQILKDVREAVQKQVARGSSENEAVSAIDLPQLKKFKGYERALEIAVRRIYREVTTKLP